MEEILNAQAGDLQEILQLQYLAYRSEAETLNDFSIQPLTQTMDELKKEFCEGIVLKAVENGKIVGSVRAKKENGTLLIGKLMVHPQKQDKGLGKRLLQAMEEACPSGRYELFTRAKNEKNVRFYERAGYTAYTLRQVPGGPEMVFLEKRRTL